MLIWELPIDEMIITFTMARWQITVKSQRQQNNPPQKTTTTKQQKQQQQQQQQQQNGRGRGG